MKKKNKLMRATEGSELIIPTATSWDCNVHFERGSEATERRIPVTATYIYPHDMRDKPDSIKVYSSYEEMYSSIKNERESVATEQIDLDNHLKNYGRDVIDLMNRILESRYASRESKTMARIILNRVRRASGASEECNGCPFGNL